MIKITKTIVSAFLNGAKKSIGNTSTDGKSLFLHGNEIAYRDDSEGIYIANAGWFSKTTKERLNAIPGFNIHQKNAAMVFKRGAMGWQLD